MLDTNDPDVTRLNRRNVTEKTEYGEKHTSCPFTLRRLNATTCLIRENDVFREHPHIYVKLCELPTEGGSSSSVLVLIDTGVGTIVHNSEFGGSPAVWTIWTFLERFINPEHRIPYLVILSHCHYDHILGLWHSLAAASTESSHKSRKPSVTVASSSYDPLFVSPWSTLQRHSLCTYVGLLAPKYTVDIWAKDSERIRNPHKANATLPITVLHTPGHTPDSLACYDHDQRIIFVGDSLYYRETPETISAPWGRESPEAVFFTIEGNILDWWNSVEKLLTFLWRQNQSALHLPRVKLCAGHTTVDTDAEKCLTAAKTFMGRVLRGEVPQLPLGDFQGQPRAHWTDAKPGDETNPTGETVSIVAPLSVIEKGRKQLLTPSKSKLF